MSSTCLMYSVPINRLLRGHIDRFDLQGRLAHLRGWIFHEDTPISSVDVRIQNKVWVEQTRLTDREDVRSAYEPLIGPLPHAAQSGFNVTSPVVQPIQNPTRTLIELTPYTPQGCRLHPLLTHFCPPQEQLNTSPLPPTILQERVGGSKDFLQVGAQLATLIMTCVGKHKRDFLAGNVLDWGCGCGRVAAQLVKLMQPERLHACDIDRDAIEWDRENIPGPMFTHIPPFPPTTYSDRYFDVVYGISVMTHLAEEAQILWLHELQRITRPGAIVLLSVIGETLRQTNMPPTVREVFDRKGFATFVPGYSDMLLGSAPAGYYQEAYHSLEYIGRVWGRYFELLEYVETKHQDLVILRKRPRIPWRRWWR